MADERREIPLVNLVLDVNNPRLGDDLDGQLEALRQLVVEQGPKLLALATDLVAHGQDPSSVCLVMPAGNGSSDYLVLEGNRRVAALKLLDSPELAAAVLNTTMVRKFRALRAKLTSPIHRVFCAILPDEEAARHWLLLKHTGEAGGAGVVSWTSLNGQRFEARHGRAGLGLSVLRLLDEHGGKGEGPIDLARDFPVTTLERILGTAHVQERLGLQVQDGELHTLHQPKALVPALRWIVNDLATGNTKVGKLLTKSQRQEYIDKTVPQHLIPRLPRSGSTRRHIGGSDASTAGGDFKGGAVKVSAKSPTRRLRPRKPGGPVAAGNPALRVKHPRGQAIYEELRQLRADDFPNAVGVLLRLFLELSVDELGKRHPAAKALPKKSRQQVTLKDKVLTAAKWLEKEGHLTKHELAGLRQTASGPDFSPGSLDVLHAWVHNPLTQPVPPALQSAWNSWAPFLQYVWK